MNDWVRDLTSVTKVLIKDNKRLWNTGYFANYPYPEISVWHEHWTVADLINNHYCNHRSYNSLEEAIEGE